MEQVKVHYDRAGIALTVLFGDPQEEYVAEATGNEVVFMKDRNGKVLGLERLNFVVPESERLNVACEAVGRDVVQKLDPEVSPIPWLSTKIAAGSRMRFGLEIWEAPLVSPVDSASAFVRL